MVAGDREGRHQKKINVMDKPSHKLIVVGQGAAGLAAALAAAETTRASNLPATVTIVDKASENEAGGNTRWSPSYMRMASPTEMESTFVDDMLKATRSQGDGAYFSRLAAEAPGTIKWIASHGVEFIQPTYYLAKGPPRIQPSGGGPTIIRNLSDAARQAGVSFRYGCSALDIATDSDRITGLAVEQDGRREMMPADAVVLTCGGFQGNREMMRAHFGDRAMTMQLISPGARFNSGDGIRMAEALGADLSGDWNGMHAEPVDARSRNSAPVVLVYPYGIVVDKNGHRFFDEGGGLVHETWERFARDIHFSAPGSIAYAILDARLFEIADYQRAIRSEVPPVRANTLAELAELIGVHAGNLVGTVAAYNAACSGDADSFDAARCDGLAAGQILQPPKSNWARAINTPPFLAYPLVGAIAYTFGGVATDARARVMRNGAAIPGLYAAGEITGHFYATAPNAVSMLRALVFGRIAAQEAVEHLRSLVRDAVA
jgi:tricarballylate dehydrogenase